MKSFKQFIVESNPFYKKDEKDGARLLGSKVPKNFKNDYEKSGTANIIGHPAETHHHIAALSQVLRNPNYETLHHVFTNGDKIVGHTAVSNRLPSIVQPFKSNQEYSDSIDHMRNHMKNIGADGYYMVHNHPNGDPRPSPQDHSFTDGYESLVSGFKGHVIVNHKTFAAIHPRSKKFDDDDEAHDTTDGNGNKWGKYTLHKIDQQDSYDMTHHAKPHDSLGKKVNNPSSIADVAKTFQNPNHATVFGVTPKLSVQAAAHIPLHQLHGDDDVSKLKAHARLRKFIKMTGSGGNVVVGVPHDDDVDKLHHLIHAGLAVDVVSHSGKSARWNGVEPPSKNVVDSLGGSIKQFRKEQT